MHPCEICGNDIDDGVAVCPFCQRPQTRGGGKRRRRAKQRRVDLEHDRPTVAEALRRLELRLDTARAGGGGSLRVIHGWGSSGKGGAIRDAVRARLRELEARGLVRGWREEAGNRGVTVVDL